MCTYMYIVLGDFFALDLTELIKAWTPWSTYGESASETQWDGSAECGIGGWGACHPSCPARQSTI